MNRLFKKYRQRTNLVLGSMMMFVLIGTAIFAPVLAPTHPYKDADLMVAEEPPSGKFWFGTDSQGRDILSRVIYGSRISLSIGLITQLVNSIIGVTLGLTAGYFGGLWDDLVSGLTNIMLSIPSLIFALAIMGLLGPGLVNLYIAMGLTNWSYSCRITRSQVLSVRSLAYVSAAKGMGYKNSKILISHVLPNILGPILVITTLGVGSAILTEAALSFLGLGAQPPTPSWGGMLSNARDQFFTAPWIALFPGLSIFFTVLGFNLLGDGLRDILDPHTIWK
jgi:peptide/nickel transport system permease protein